MGMIYKMKALYRQQKMLEPQLKCLLKRFFFMLINNVGRLKSR